MAQTDNASAVESPADFGAGDEGAASRWISEIDLAEKDAKNFVARGRKIIKRYENDQDAGSTDVKARRLAVFWANMEILEPATVARAPVAVVGRRWKNNDPIARWCSEVLERSLNFTLDSSAVFDTIKDVAKDYLLVGRGVPWVRYLPHMVKVEPEDVPEGDSADDPDGELGEGYERVAWEEVVIDHVSWDDFLHNPARKWAEVRWVARITYQTRDELKERFGDELGEAIPLDHGEEDGGDGQDKDSQFSKAAIYEIWDKASRTAIWVSKGYTASLLDQRDDPLSLKDFFPCPRPALATRSPRSILPIADYNYIEGQLRDINELTSRIGLLSDALKVRGFYASGGEEKEKLQDLLASDTNTLIPIDSWAAMQDKGGLKGLIEWMPIDMVVAVLQGAVEARQKLIEDVYQITGIADILRGEVDADETATASRTKANWGSLRVRNKQKEMARVARDTLRICAEVIATKFSPETLAEMTDFNLLPNEQAKAELQQQLQAQAAQAQAMQQHAQMAAQQAQQLGQPAPPPLPAPPPPPPQVQEQLQNPTWDEITQLLRDNVMRGFRIDVETDSTIEPDDQDEKMRRIEFVQAVGEYISRSLPAVQMLPAIMPVITQGLLFLVRGFRVGREMEDVIERAMEQIQQAGVQPPPQAQGKAGDPPQVQQAKVQADTVRAQADMLKAHAAMTQAQTGQFEAQAGAHLEGQRIQAEDQRTNLDRQADMQMHGQDLAADIHQAVLKAVQRRAVGDMMDRKPIEAPTR